MNPPSLSSVLAKAKGILFDMDGVLIDSEPIHEQAIVALSAELGEAITDHDLLFSFKGAPEKTMAARLMEIYPGQRLSAEELIRRKVDLYASIFHNVKLIEGAKEFIERSYAAGRKHGLTTSASRSTQQLTFETFGFSPFFDAIITGEDITQGKPHPEPYLITAEKLGLAAADCIVIEDSINGVKSGKAAGCQVIAITTTFPKEQLLEAGAHFVVDAFSGIV